jgi:cold shock CspA family protein
MPKGKVREYDMDHGEGIIVDSNTGQSLIVYANYVCLKHRKILHEDQDVEYEIDCSQHRNWAVNVRILG